MVEGKRGGAMVMIHVVFGFQFERRHYSIDTRWRPRRYRRGETSRSVENPTGIGRVRDAPSF